MLISDILVFKTQETRGYSLVTPTCFVRMRAVYHAQYVPYITNSKPAPHATTFKTKTFLDLLWNTTVTTSSKSQGYRKNAFRLQRTNKLTKSLIRLYALLCRGFTGYKPRTKIYLKYISYIVRTINCIIIWYLWYLGW